MTSLSAFTAPGRFWRGNLHTHSTRSDGVVSPEEVCRRYRAEGYDFLARLCRKVPGLCWCRFVYFQADI